MSTEPPRLYWLASTRTMLRFLGCWLVVALATSPVHAAELTNADAVLDCAVAQTAGCGSYSAAFVQNTDLPNGQMRHTGTIVFKRPTQMRMEMSLAPQSQHSLVVIGSDQIIWQEVTMSGQTRVMKTDLQNIPTNHPAAAAIKNFSKWDPKSQLVKARDLYSFALLSASELHGQPMYVLAGELRTDAKGTPSEVAFLGGLGQQKILIGKLDGFLHRSELFDKVGSNTVYAMEFTDLKRNLPLTDNLFVYQVPRGATVVDMAQVLRQVPNPGPKPPVPVP